MTGNRVMTSPDGLTWTIRGTTGLDYAWSSVTFANGLFVAVATTGTTMTSYDGISWTARPGPNTNSWRRVAYGNGLFVAVAGTGTGNRVMTCNTVQLAGFGSGSGGVYLSVVQSSGLDRNYRVSVPFR